MKLLTWYASQVQKRPVITQSLMSSTLVATGDVIAQHLFSETDYSIKRTLKFGAIGLLYGGPILAKWYLFLEPFSSKSQKYFPKYLNKRVVMKKVLLDQFVLQAPYTSGVLILNGLLNGVLLNDSLKMIKGSLLEILMTGWPYWILVQSANFTLVPFAYRMLSMQFFAILWNVFLSWKATVAADNAKNNNQAKHE